MKYLIAKRAEDITSWAAEFKARPIASKKESGSRRQEFKVEFNQAGGEPHAWEDFFHHLGQADKVFFFNPEAPDYKITDNTSVIDQTSFEAEEFEGVSETDITESDHQHVE